MTIKDDEKDTQHTDHHDTDLSTLYQSLSNEQPSSSMDDIVLKLAQQTSKTRRQKLWLSKWSTPVSIAAVVVLSVSIVTVLQQESARSPEIRSVAMSPSDTQTLQKNKKSDTAKIFDLNVRNEIPETERAPISGVTENDAENEISITPSEERSLRNFSDKNIVEQIENRSAPVADIANGEVQPSRNVSGKPTQAQLKRKTISSDLSKSIQLEAKQSRQPSQQPLRQSLRQRLQKAAIPMSKMRTPPQAMTKPLATLENSAMSSDPTSTIQKKERSRSGLTLAPIPKQKSKQKPKSFENVCAKTSHSRCLASSTCILIKDSSADKDLRCIEARSYCEKQFIQKDAEPTQCLLKKNCWFRPGICQCNGDENCTCKKAGPPMCAPIN